MGEKRNFAALEWVIGEISDTLKEARQSLEAYVEDPKDSARIRFCLTHIHQVHGSLQMVEFHGAALLAEEMEQTAQAVMDNTVVSIPEAQEVLMRGLLQLPIYLEHVKSAKEDNPARVMPLLNDMRAVRKQSYLSETNLFSPELSAVGKTFGERHSIQQDLAKLTQVLKKLREMYQFAAASVLRGIKVDENLGYLSKVFSRLVLITRGSVSHPIWEVSEALVDGLKRDDIELTVAVRGLLRYIARELRILGEKAPASLDMTPRESLLKNLLYYVGRAEEGSEKIAAVKQKYHLDRALLGPGDKQHSDVSDDILPAPDADAIRSVVVALQDELANVKRVLDLSLSGRGSAADLKEVLPVVKRVSDTLAVLGIGDLRKQMIAQSERLESISEANSVDENALMQIASNIIEIEHRLLAIANSAGRQKDLSNVNEREVQIDNAKATVVKECIAGLHEAKESIVDYISSQWDKRHLKNIGAQLTDIRGGLNMIPLSRPAAIVDACGNFIRENLLSTDEHPGFESLESLADAMASVEYYLERLMEDLYEDSDSMLDIAEDSVASLGYAIETQVYPEQLREVAGEALPTPEAEEGKEIIDSLPFSDEPETNGELELETRESSATKAEPQNDRALKSAELSAEPLTFEQLDPAVYFVEDESDLETGVECPEENTVGEDTAITDGPTVDAEEPIQEIVAEREQTIASTHEGKATPETFENDIDEEIVEIFIEEAGEVLETLHEYFPRWKDKHADQDALVVVRRAFHTLKGSGRMVEAFDIGELAWSVENMLNRVIDRTISVQPHVFHLAEAVISVIPELVKAFENRHVNPQKALTSQYEAWAHQIAEGNFPGELAQPLALFGREQHELAPEPVFDESQAESNFTRESEEDEQDVDRVLQEIFSQESVTHLETMEGFIRQMEEEAPLYTVPTDALQRALHTLKGSAKMAQVWPIAEIAEPLEQFTKELIAFQQSIDDDILQLLKDAVDYTRYGLHLILQDSKVEIPKADQFIARTQELRNLAVGHLVYTRGSEDRSPHKVDPRLLSLVMAEEMALLLEADSLLDRWKGGTIGDEIHDLMDELSILEEGAQQAHLQDMASLCASLRDTYSKALTQQIPTEEAFFSTMHNGHEALLDMVDAVAAGQNVLPPPDELKQAIEGLIGSVSAPQPEVAVDQQLSQGLEELIDIESTAEDLSAELSDEQAVHDSPQEMELSVEDLSGDINEESLSFEIDENGSEINFEFNDDEPLVLGSEEIPLFNDRDSADQDDDPATTSETVVFNDDIWAASTEELASDGPDLSGLEKILSSEAEEEEEGSGEFTEAIDLNDIFDATGSEGVIAEESYASEESADISKLLGVEERKGTAEGEQLELNDAIVDVVEEDDLGETVESEAESIQSNDTQEALAPADGLTESDQEIEAADTRIPGLLDMIDIHSDDFDRDILEVFLEEADELVEGLDDAIHAWESNWSDSESLEEIKRILHTLKGGARLAGLNNFGELTHDYETMLIDMGEDLSIVDNKFFSIIHGYQDKVLSAVKAVKAFAEGEYETAEIVAEPQSGEVPESESENVAVAETESSNVVKFEPKPKIPPAPEAGEFTLPTIGGGASGAQAATTALKKAGPQEVVKVSAELLEELVNLAGETSINRSRLEQYVNDFSFALDEVDSTLNRLQDQIRRLDIETEAQILFRQEQMEAHDEFDPLEMDRYSHLQQLSRSLIESASDLTDLKTDLGDKLKITETLLLQQSRINTTLQEGLMRSRMVPFSRLVPRLRRIVRQVSAELGKNVSFELDNVEGELDRSVLERMVPPFEHMLRNAVDHGIENPEDRSLTGKPETGRIVLTLSREGGDVIIRLADDGRGIDLKRVREKAVERELMSSDSELSDHDIMQFILHAGFSTAENVTQISGRGVGMDVVNAEIKQLGGSVTINSAWGKGTEFVIRLPFTLSVNRALMVAIGHDHYAVPLSSIEGIVRVSPFELEHYYANPEAQFEYASENYHVRYLGTLLNTGAQPTLEGHVLPLPVMLVRSAEHTMALQVDAVMGSREIVVKSLGQQFSTVAGLSGATVMGDGSVVVILDPHALVRQDIARATLQLEHGMAELRAAENDDTRIKTVMVVDDSVTVRKVTTRFLEREGFDVITAKDGVDALRLLQDGLPDLMLLDIEMPRMDGFEVAKTVRTTKRWESLPIIMITSRTGDKHREHALSLGVNNYLGKPYQEDLLLEAIGEILDHKTAQY